MRVRAFNIMTTAAAVVALAAGCGGSAGSGGSTDDDTAASPPETADEFDPATAQLPADLFCDQVDNAAVAQVLGVAPGKVELDRQVKVGDEQETIPGQPPTKATHNSCQYSAGKQFRFSVGVGPGFSQEQQSANLRSAMERSKVKRPKNAVLWQRCSAEETDAVGETGYVESCELVGSEPVMKTVSVSGLAGSDRFTCYLVGPLEGKASALTAPVASTCGEIMATVATG